MTKKSRKSWELELGANLSNRGVRFRVWAPEKISVSLVVTEESRNIPMDPKRNGYFTTFLDDAEPGTRYFYLLNVDSLKITITPFIASLGIGGVVVGLAMQDTLSNFFSWAYIVSNKPIRGGDYIQFEAGKEGYVDRIGWRNVRVRTLSNNILIIPNNKLVSSPVTNFYLPESELAVLVNVGVAYQSDLEKVEKVTIEVAREVLQETEGAVKEFQPFIRYNALGESSINFTVILRAKEYTDQHLIIHEFIKRLHRRYQREEIEMPFPTRTVYLKGEGSKTP